MSRILETGLDIYEDVIDKCDVSMLAGPNDSAFSSLARRYIQRAYYDVLSAEPWPWAMADPPGIIQCSPSISKIATITTGSASVTITTTYATSLAGYWLWLTEEYLPYRILSHTAGSALLTLDAPYQTDDGEAGGGSGISVEIFKDEYEVATRCLRVWRVWNRTNPSAKMDLITEGEMSGQYPDRTYGNWPRKAALVRNNKLRIAPWPQINYCTIEYEYAQKPSADLTFDGNSTTDIPIVPLEDRHVISDIALSYLDPSKATGLMAAVSVKISQMKEIYIPVGQVRMYVRKGGGLW